MILLKLKFKWK